MTSSYSEQNSTTGNDVVGLHADVGGSIVDDAPASVGSAFRSQSNVSTPRDKTTSPFADRAPANEIDHNVESKNGDVTTNDDTFVDRSVRIASIVTTKMAANEKKINTAAAGSGSRADATTAADVAATTASGTDSDDDCVGATTVAGGDEIGRRHLEDCVKNKKPTPLWKTTSTTQTVVGGGESPLPSSGCLHQAGGRESDDIDPLVKTTASNRDGECSRIFASTCSKTDRASASQNEGRKFSDERQTSGGIRTNDEGVCRSKRKRKCGDKKERRRNSSPPPYDVESAAKAKDEGPGDRRQKDLRAGERENSSTTPGSRSSTGVNDDRPSEGRARERPAHASRRERPHAGTKNRSSHLAAKDSPPENSVKKLQSLVATLEKSFTNRKRSSADQPKQSRCVTGRSLAASDRKAPTAGSANVDYDGARVTTAGHRSALPGNRIRSSARDVASSNIALSNKKKTPTTTTTSGLATNGCFFGRQNWFTVDHNIPFVPTSARFTADDVATRACITRPDKHRTSTVDDEGPLDLSFKSVRAGRTTLERSTERSVSDFTAPTTTATGRPPSGVAVSESTASGLAAARQQQQQQQEQQSISVSPFLVSLEEKFGGNSSILRRIGGGRESATNCTGGSNLFPSGRMSTSGGSVYLQDLFSKLHQQEATLLTAGASGTSSQQSIANSLPIGGGSLPTKARSHRAKTTTNRVKDGHRTAATRGITLPTPPPAAASGRVFTAGTNAAGASPAAAVLPQSASRYTSSRCETCGTDFSSLYRLAVHLEETGHSPSASGDGESFSGGKQPSRRATGGDTHRPSDFNASDGGGGIAVVGGSGAGAGEYPKLVRGQDVWLSQGNQQTRQILRCMQCQRSFSSLPELTVHMIRTRHYADIVGDDSVTSATAAISGRKFDVKAAAAPASAAGAVAAAATTSTTPKESGAEVTTPPPPPSSATVSGTAAGCDSNSSRSNYCIPSPSSSSSSNYRRTKRRGSSEFLPSLKAEVNLAHEIGTATTTTTDDPRRREGEYNDVGIGDQTETVSGCVSGHDKRSTDGDDSFGKRKRSDMASSYAHVTAATNGSTGDDGEIVKVERVDLNDPTPAIRDRCTDKHKSKYEAPRSAVSYDADLPADEEGSKRDKNEDIAGTVEGEKCPRTVETTSSGVHVSAAVRYRRPSMEATSAHVTSNVESERYVGENEIQTGRPSADDCALGGRTTDDDGAHPARPELNSESTQRSVVECPAGSSALEAIENFIEKSFSGTGAARSAVNNAVARPTTVTTDLFPRHPWTWMTSPFDRNVCLQDMPSAPSTTTTTALQRDDGERRRNRMGIDDGPIERRSKRSRSKPGQRRIRQRSTDVVVPAAASDAAAKVQQPKYSRIPPGTVEPGRTRRASPDENGEDCSDNARSVTPRWMNDDRKNIASDDVNQKNSPSPDNSRSFDAASSVSLDQSTETTDDNRVSSSPTRRSKENSSPDLGPKSPSPPLVACTLNTDYIHPDRRTWLDAEPACGSGGGRSSALESLEGLVYGRRQQERPDETKFAASDKILKCRSRRLGDDDDDSGERKATADDRAPGQRTETSTSALPDVQQDGRSSSTVNDDHHPTATVESKRPRYGDDDPAVGVGGDGGGRRSSSGGDAPRGRHLNDRHRHPPPPHHQQQPLQQQQQPSSSAKPFRFKDAIKISPYVYLPLDHSAQFSKYYELANDLAKASK